MKDIIKMHYGTCSVLELDSYLGPVLQIFLAVTLHFLNLKYQSATAGGFYVLSKDTLICSQTQ